MKIILQRNECHRLIGGGTSNGEVSHKFCNIANGLYWYDLGDSYEPAGMHIVGVLPRDVYFSFKVKEIINDSVVLEVGGAAGGGLKKDDHVYLPQLITLNLNESKSFATKTKDKGIIYTILLTNDDEKIERKRFREFNLLFLTYGDLDKEEASIYAPLIYSLEDKYYDAAVNCLKNGIITHLQVGEFTISDILSGYWLDEKISQKRYLETLIILSNLEKYKEDAYSIYNPYTIE